MVNDSIRDESDLLLDSSVVQTVVPASPHAPVWLYWAEQANQFFDEPCWSDGVCPVLAVGTVDGREGAVLICTPCDGPKWIRVCYRAEVDTNLRFITVRVGLRPPALGGPCAPPWITEGRKYMGAEHDGTDPDVGWYDAWEW